MNRFPRWTRALIGGALVFLFSFRVLPVQADAPVVRAVLFYSPACPHCHKVITEDLPPLVQKYGARLEITGVDVTEPNGSAMYEAAIDQFNIQNLGVPTLIVGDVVLVGSEEIPQRFPGLIEHHLAQGGVAWPDLPEFAEAMTAAHPTPTASAAPLASIPPAAATATSESTARVPIPAALATAMALPSPSSQPTVVALVTGVNLPENHVTDLREKLARDPAGNGLAVIVLTAMVFTVARSVGFWLGGRGGFSSCSGSWECVIPILALIGLGVAAYLAFVETTHTAAVCGPVGDCNTVQQSEYARLFGVLPIGVLGVSGYITILIIWAAGRFAQDERSDRVRIALFALTFLGTLFSIYLTFLEPFVIGATCAWCLTSAIVMTALLWLIGSPGQQAARRWRSK